MLAFLGAARALNAEHVQQQSEHAQMADTVYSSGFLLASSADAVWELIRLRRPDQLFAFNLSAEYVCHAHGERLWQLLPHVDLLFCNGEELAAFAKFNKWQVKFSQFWKPLQFDRVNQINSLRLLWKNILNAPGKRCQNDCPQTVGNGRSKVNFQSIEWKETISSIDHHSWTKSRSGFWTPVHTRWHCFFDTNFVGRSIGGHCRSGRCVRGRIFGQTTSQQIVGRMCADGNILRSASDHSERMSAEGNVRPRTSAQTVHQTNWRMKFARRPLDLF